MKVKCIDVSEVLLKRDEIYEVLDNSDYPYPRYLIKDIYDKKTWFRQDRFEIYDTQEEIRLIEASYVFEQEKDCCDGESDFSQYLTIETNNGGGGPFIVLKTERWAIDDIDAFANRLKNILSEVDE